MIYAILFFTFFKIGLFTFGGGYAMLPLIQDEVIKNNWVSLGDFINFVAVSESTPGPFAINMATYIGSVQGTTALPGAFGSVLGAFCATLGVVMPSFIIILMVARLYEQFKNSRLVAGCMSGLKPAAVALIASAVVTMGKTVFLGSGITASVLADAKFYVSLAIFAIMSFLLHKKVHPIVVICISAVLGIIAGYIIN